MAARLKTLLLLIACYALFQSLHAQELQPLNFSLLLQGGVGDCSGFLAGSLGNSNPAPEGGLWLGIGLDQRFDGLWGMDYYTMPNQSVTLSQTPTASNPATFFYVQPTDDVALSVNLRWYWADKYDFTHKRFNTVPYLLVGMGMDLVVDQPPPPPPPPGVTPPPAPFVPFYNKSFDILFSGNVGGGMDFPFDKQWIFYVEGLDHFIVWQGLTQIVAARVGIKLMVDTAHIDPFR